MSNIDARARAMGDDDWAALREEVLELFTPGSPVDEAALFAGRQAEIQKLRDTLASKGRHAVVFGERGVGKTSIANIFYLGTSRVSRVHRIYVQCGSADEYADIWAKAFKRIKFVTESGETVQGDQVVPHANGPDDVELVLDQFGPNDIPIIVFDEFDRMKSERVRSLMSETIKHLSNAPFPGMIVVVGIADSVTQLIESHQSLSRALVQVPMPRMTPEELRDIIVTRLGRTPLVIDEDAIWRITQLASGLPFYTHALGQSAAIRAVERRTLRITEEIVQASIPLCFDDLDHTLIDAYVKATVATRKGNIFKEVLAACALSEQDELGRFSAANVETTLSAIIGREMKAPAFSFHLNDLCEPERGGILEKAGTRSHFRFRFVEPMMQPYIVMKSLSTMVIDTKILGRFSAQRQRDLF